MGYILLGLYDALAYTGGGTFWGLGKEGMRLLGQSPSPE